MTDPAGNPYSPLKVFHHRARLDVLKAGGQPVPTQLIVVPSDLCGQNCSFCAFRLDGYTNNDLFHVLRDDGTKDHNPNRMIPTPKLKEILDDCVAMGIPAVQFSGGGEPTVHPDHREVFAYALDAGREVALITNGVIWRPGIADLLARMAWVRVSVDAGTRETYRSIRGTDTYDAVHDHLAELVAARRRAASRTLIGYGYVVTAENYREVRRACEVARDLGIDNFRISAAFQGEGAAYFAPFHREAAEACRSCVEDFGSPTFRVSNLFGDRMADLDQVSPEYGFCGYQHFSAYVGGDQNVYRCCNTAYHPRGLVGSIKGRRFRDLWESAGKRADYAAFDARGCTNCRFNDKNRAILYALADAPVHANFV